MSIPSEPLALQFYKRRRWCTVGKITRLRDTGEAVLAVVWRSQGGTTHAVPLPPAALELAKKMGVKRFLLRDDRSHQMWGATLEAFDQVGWTGYDGERYLPIEALTPCPWGGWLYAERVVHLNEPPAESVQAKQLLLWSAAR